MNAIRQKSFHPSSRLQTTIGDRVRLSGQGVHSNAPANLVLHPADSDTGVVFMRTDAANAGGKVVVAEWSQVTMTELCTVIGDSSEASISTIEHLMSALSGLGIDNVLVEVDGPEVPILDGSAVQFVDAIDEVGLAQLAAPRRFLKIHKPVRVEIGRGFAELLPAEEGFRLEVEIDFDNEVIGRQKKIFDLDAQTYRTEISRARTFGFLRDVERLWKAGFALGASLDNTVALEDERVLNPEGLRYPDEFVRHKTLDAIGDLALAGRPIIGHYRSYCGGHRLNVAVLEALFADPDAYSFVDGEQAVRRVAAGGAVAAAAVFGPDVR